MNIKLVQKIIHFMSMKDIERLWRNTTAAEKRALIFASAGIKH